MKGKYLQWRKYHQIEIPITINQKCKCILRFGNESSFNIVTGSWNSSCMVEGRQSFLVVEKQTTRRFFENHVNAHIPFIIFYINAKYEVIERKLSIKYLVFKKLFLFIGFRTNFTFWN